MRKVYLHLIYIIGVTLLTLLPRQAAAQTFAVDTFKVLPNDVSAFISSVRDLNDEACALVKVVAPADFAFSSPLGIVKRKDETGEIWLYLPKGSRMMTLKHPEWGVLRNYKFERPLESRMTYEMRIRLPEEALLAKHDTVVMTQTVVDTITIRVERKREPLMSHILATAALHTDGVNAGLMLTLMRKHGAFIHAAWDFSSIGTTDITCHKDGSIYGRSNMPYYSGNKRTCNYTLTAGAIHRVWKPLCVFEGIGYGNSAVAWELAASEGGGYAFNEGLEKKGFAAEIGALYTFNRLTVAASVITIAGQQWHGNIGIGIRLGGRK